MSRAAKGRALIARALEDGRWHPAAAIYSRLEVIGVSDREARRLAAELQVERRRENYGGPVLWRRAAEGAPEVRPVDISPNEVRQRIARRIGVAPGTRIAFARLVRAISEADRAGEPAAFADLLLEAAAELVSWHDRLTQTRP